MFICSFLSKIKYFLQIIILKQVKTKIFSWLFFFLKFLTAWLTISTQVVKNWLHFKIFYVSLSVDTQRLRKKLLPNVPRYLEHTMHSTKLVALLVNQNWDCISIIYFVQCSGPLGFHSVAHIENIYCLGNCSSGKKEIHQ